MTEEDGDRPLSLVLFSGTDDKLTAAAVMAVGAAAMGRRVNVFLQYYALDAFRADRVHDDHGLVPEAGLKPAARIRANGRTHWSELLSQAKEAGDVDVEACALSMDTLGIRRDELHPLVDGVEGVAAFMAAAADGPIVFI